MFCASLTHCRAQAHDAILVSRGDTPEHTAERLRAALGTPPDVVIDCCGFEDTMQTALLACNRCVRPACCYIQLIAGNCFFSLTVVTAVRRGGKVCLVGMGNSSTMRLSLSAAAIKEVDIVGSFRYASASALWISRHPLHLLALTCYPRCWPTDTYPLCISLMSSKRVDVLPLITHRFGWSASQLLAGFEAAASGKAIKVMFTGLAERAQM